MTENGKNIKIEDADELFRSVLEQRIDNDMHEETETKTELPHAEDAFVEDVPFTKDELSSSSSRSLEEVEASPRTETFEELDAEEPADPSSTQESLEPSDSSKEDENKLSVLEAERNDFYDRLVRVSADFDNFRKRSIKEKADLRKYGSETLLRDVLGVLDNFERALQQTKEDYKSLQQGIQMVHKQLLDVFDRHGAKRFEAKGQAFDYTCHEAISVQETNEVPPGHVLEVFQGGYRLHDRLLRPAMVIVAEAPKERTDDEMVHSTTEVEEIGVDLVEHEKPLSGESLDGIEMTMEEVQTNDKLPQA